MQTKTFLNVRYAETDQMGIAHHSNYAVWFEVGRTHFLKAVGFSYSEIEKKGILFPLYELNCRFKSPAKYEDDVVVLTTLKSCSRVRVCFEYQVFNVLTNQLIATGETMHAWTDKNLKPIDAKKALPELFSMLNEITIKEKGEN